MAVPDVNAVLRKYLAANADIIAFFLPAAPRIFCPRLPENTELPAVGLFVRGGISTPYIPPLLSPSFQIDCWHDNPIGARSLYLAVYTALQGIQQVPVVIGATTYYIKSAIEEVGGQDLVDAEIQNYFRVLSFFQIIISE